MKRIHIIFGVFLCLVSFVACKKSHDFLRDNTMPTGVGFIPISNNTLQDVSVNPVRNLGTTTAGATVYAKGATLTTELTYFSQSPVKEINLYNTIGSGTRTLVNTIPYAPAFSNSKRLDTLLVAYTIPASAASNTVIRLDFEIKNVNSLAATRTAFVKVQ